MSQSKDHPEGTYVEALNTLKSRDGAEGVESPENPAENESPDGDGAGPVESGAVSDDGAEGVGPSPEGADKGVNPSGENPLLRTPLTDGGEEIDEESNDGNDDARTCPDCDKEMRNAAEDREVTGLDRRGRKVRVVTDGEGTELWCPRCRVLKADVDGDTVVVR